jgi:hypothetical protein
MKGDLRGVIPRLRGQRTGEFFTGQETLARLVLGREAADVPEAEAGAEPARAARAPLRVPWAELRSRVFKVGVLKSQNCGGRMTTVLAFLTERTAVKKILEHLGLPATALPKALARGAAQPELDERPADELRDQLPNHDW